MLFEGLAESGIALYSRELLFTMDDRVRNGKVGNVDMEIIE